MASIFLPTTIAIISSWEIWYNRQKACKKKSSHASFSIWNVMKSRWSTYQKSKAWPIIILWTLRWLSQILRSIFRVIATVRRSTKSGYEMLVSIFVNLILKIVNTLIPSEFNEFIERLQSQRQIQVITKKQLTVKWTTEIADLIRKSKQISSNWFCYH